MKNIIQLIGGNTHECFLLAYQAFVDHINSNFYCRRRSPFARPCLQQVQLSVFNSELDVLHILVVFFQFLENPFQGIVRFGHFLLQVLNIKGRARPSDNIFALGIDHIFTVKLFLSCGRVTGKRDSRGRGFPHITEHHDLDIYRRSQIMRDVMNFSISYRPVSIPGIEYGFDGQPKL